MSRLKLVLGMAAAVAMVAAFRDTERGRWLRPALPRGAADDAWDDDGDDGERDDAPEPFLGYDGMDRETLVDHLRRARLDEATLRAVYDYERARENRTPVLETVVELLEAVPAR